MSEESEQVLALLQEMAALIEDKQSGTRTEAAMRRKRRKEIGEEIKALARHKNRAGRRSRRQT